MTKLWGSKIVVTTGLDPKSDCVLSTCWPAGGIYTGSRSRRVGEVERRRTKQTSPTTKIDIACIVFQSPIMVKSSSGDMLLYVLGKPMFDT